MVILATHASQGTLYGRYLSVPVIRHHKQKELEEGSICSGLGFQRDKSPSWQRSVVDGDKEDGRNLTASSSTERRTERILEVGQRCKLSKPALAIYFLQQHPLRQTVAPTEDQVFRSGVHGMHLNHHTLVL